MCGIYAAFSYDRELGLQHHNHTSLLHRGPDSQGEFSDSHFYTKHYRLQIVGGETGNQPMLSRTGRLLLSYNGEIYNYKELASEQLGDPSLALQGDTRVLVEFLDRFGLSRLNELNGMFAFVVYDIPQRQISLVRDRLGIKPLYYAEKNGALFIASEIKALFPQVPLEIDYEVVENYLRFGTYPIGDATFYKNIFQLEPSHSLTWRGTPSKTRYYDLASAVQAVRDPSVDEWVSLFENSIRLRLRSDIPVTLHYSGGTDSTALLIKTKEVWGWDYPLKTYTMAYPNESVDESHLASSYCREIGIRNETVPIVASEIPKLTEELTWFCDEPFGGIPSVAHYRFNQVLKEQGFTVALEGQGGDEAFGGYPYHIYLALYDLVNKGSQPDLCEKLLIHLKEEKESALRKAEKLIESGFGSHSDMTDIRERGKPATLELDSWLLTIQLHDALRNKIPRLLRFEDRSSMAASREIRFPFLDYRVLAHGMALATTDKYSGGLPKAPLVGLTRKYLGDLFRPAKRSVVSSQTIWLTGELRSWVLGNVQELRKLEVIDETHFDRFEKMMAAPQLDNSFFIWQLVNLNHMIRNLRKCYH